MFKPFRFIKFIIFLAFLALLFIFWYIETFTLSVDLYSFESQKIDKSVTFTVISDLHKASYGKDNEELIKKIKESRPDIVFAVGDMYTISDEESKARSLSLLSTLAKSYPVYFVNGDHDYEVDFLRSLSSNNVNVVDVFNDYDIVVNDNKIHIFGTGSYIYEYDDKPQILVKKNISDENFNIFMCHTPNNHIYNTINADLFLSGDTHGGVISLPIIGPVYYADHFFPYFTYKENPIYDRDLFTLSNNKHVFVSAGLSFAYVPIRIFNRPQIAVITIE